MALFFFYRKTAADVDNRISNTAIHNFSSRRLSYEERKLLGLGIKFIPRPPPMSPSLIAEEFRAFARLFRLRAFFGPDSDAPTPASPFTRASFPPKFKKRNPFWNPPDRCYPLEDILQQGEAILQKQLASVSFSARPMLPSRLLKSLKTLKRDKSIIIKPADKNLGLVILDSSWYRSEGLRQLSDSLVYERVDSVPWHIIWKRLSVIIKDFKFLLDPVSAFLTKFPPPSARPCAFYLLPKIHKPVLAGRPICSYSGYILEPASQLLHHLLFPILLEQKSHLSDSRTLLRDLGSLHLPTSCILFTFDVESLYPSIPTPAGLAALEEMVSDYFRENSFDSRLVDLIVRLATLVLTFHYLDFDGFTYKQVRGTAMGSNFAVVYACLFLCHLENRLFASFDCSELLFFKRYIDDAVGVWTGSEETLSLFFQHYQMFYPEIKITTCVSSSSVNILDITFFKGERFSASGILDTCCFQKPLNAYQYIPFGSWHPQHQKKSFIISELRRYLLRESSPSGFIQLKKMFYLRLRARGYPKNFLLQCFNKVSRTDKSVLLNKLQLQPFKRRGAPLILKLDYCSATKALNLGATLNPTLHRLCQEVPELQHISPPRVCWRNPRKLGSFLLRSRFLSRG
ncbi:uncharacterized protein LOC131042973 [Cryptomeria japonica]|uniref:uncharacterized protein LOC131042973 n=1 Tax=Cryptomeria japonica TaxID=3369 RepID=UPI0027DA75E5|nr:uncharacterized protein LOC131042973 [Cryptomeria japonica]